LNSSTSVEVQEYNDMKVQNKMKKILAEWPTQDRLCELTEYKIKPYVIYKNTHSMYNKSKT